MADGDIYKPYDIIDEHTFETGKDGLKKYKQRGGSF